MYIRPVTLDDHAAILGLAQKAGFGMTSLPPDGEVLRAKIERAVKSFAGEAASEAEESYLFVLVDPDGDVVVGLCGIVCHVGLKQPFYSYKLATITQASESLNIFSKQQVLHVVNDYTGASEIGSLYLLPEYRRDRIGRFLSRVRFVFMAEHRARFDDKVIAEIRGTHDKDGNSPFYDHLARHFFEMEFKKADYINATTGNQFITDLMPKHPIYVGLLPKVAQEAVGRPYPSSEPAKAMLEREGFRWNQYLDIFDGGPTMEAETDRVATLKDSASGKIAAIEPYVEGEKHIMATSGLADFRATVGRLREDYSDFIISERAAGVLGVTVGDSIRSVKA